MNSIFKKSPSSNLSRSSIKSSDTLFKIEEEDSKQDIKLIADIKSEVKEETPQVRVKSEIMSSPGVTSAYKKTKDHNVNTDTVIPSTIYTAGTSKTSHKPDVSEDSTEVDHGTVTLSDPEVTKTTTVAMSEVTSEEVKVIVTATGDEAITVSELPNTSTSELSSLDVSKQVTQYNI